MPDLHNTIYCNSLKTTHGPLGGAVRAPVRAAALRDVIRREGALEGLYNLRLRHLRKPIRPFS